MTDLLPQPCARWADLLAAHPDDLSTEERRALDAHVASCQACVAVRADYQRMSARIRSLPDPRMRPDLPPWLLALQAAAGRDAPVPSLIIPFQSTENHMKMRKESGQVVPAPAPSDPGQQARRRVVSWVSAVAALAVIALITTALLVSHAGKPGTTGHGENAATSTPAGSQGWNSPPGLAHLSAQPFLAPSNPRVVYLLGSRPIALKRSDDSGAHWKNLTLPEQTSQAYSAIIQINAGDAQNVFLTLTFQQSASACSGNQTAPGAINAYSGYSCQLSYYSTDGGTHWGLMKWSAQAGVSGAVGVIGEIITQDNRLYSLSDRNQQQRLITSADGGATWQFADASLRARGQGLCSVAAAPTGSAVFAFVQSGYCSQAKGYLHSDVTLPQAGAGLAIWRSDDAGAHWLQVSRFPYQQPDTQAFMAVDTGGAQPTLLAAEGQGATYTRLVSTDGGKTWQQLPTSPNILASSQTTLSDGSILMTGQTPGGTTSIFAWKPGSQSWRQIASPFTGSPMELVVSPSANGQQTLWLVTISKGEFSVLYSTIK